MTKEMHQSYCILTKDKLGMFYVCILVKYVIVIMRSIKHGTDSFL